MRGRRKAPSEHAVELAGAVHLNGARGRAERRHQAGQESIALLPVGARDMKRYLRLVRLDQLVVPSKVTNVSSVGQLAGREPHAAAVEGVVQRPADRDRRQRQMIAEWAPVVRARSSAAAMCASVSSRPMGVR